MDYFAHGRPELLEAMESCRAEKGELGDPEFAELDAALAGDAELRTRFDMQRCDTAIRSAFAQVSVPAGLPALVASRLAEAAPAVAASGTLSAPDAGADLPRPLRKEDAPRQSEVFSRRRLFAGFTALAASAALLTAVWIRTHQQPPVTPERAMDEAMALFGESAPRGELVVRVAPPPDFPFSRDLRTSSLTRWRPVKDFLGSEAVAYDLPAIRGKATLYVVQRTVAGLPPSAPSAPMLSTGGNSTAAWQQGNMLYVLVVQGDTGTYSQYLDQTSGPLT